ncbi:hypothetical protein Q4595_17005, partial [Wenyingzhuangia sp. 1_MG-2023]|nr:hypothetical protein [Wenyingzhuangia sp. 1_MG-2023]
MSDAPEGMIPVEEFAKLKGITASKAIDMVRDGFYVGRKVGDDWYVDISEPSNTASKPPRIHGSVVVSTGYSAIVVVVADFQM